MTYRLLAMFAALSIGAAVTDARAGNLSVASVSPPLNGSNAAPGTKISVTFDQPVLPSSVTPESFWAFGRWSGSAEGTFSFSADLRTVTLAPAQQFSAGELVMVILSHELQANDGSSLRAGGFSWQFTVRARPASLDYAPIQSLSTQIDRGESVRTYGAGAWDLNNDGWLDLTSVNEFSADLRVFLNDGARGLGMYGKMVLPTFTVDAGASPSEPSDFNRDGNTDACVASAAGTVSILLGDGLGGYGPVQLVDVGSNPRGIAVLDADGDGDVDIVNTNYHSDNLSVLLNDGTGVFGKPDFFEGGGDEEYGLVASDMDEDGLLDLVVGARGGEEILVVRANGDATFSPLSDQDAGGSVRIVTSGDLNGDGHVDVACANSLDDTGSILLGDGNGGLSAPVVVRTDSNPLGTDVGDLDGDGDLDWILSSFGGDWRVFLNDGDGTFTFDQEFASPQAASCAVMFDTDRDGDLDIGLIDELEDVIIVLRSGGIATAGDVNVDGVVNVVDLLDVVNAWGPCPLGAVCPADVTGDGKINVDDLLLVINGWG